MKRLMLTLLAILAFLIILLALAPATWLDAGLQRHSQGLVGLAEAKGSLWRGSGVIQAILPSGQVETLEAVHWTLEPGALLTARLHLSMLADRDGKPVLDATLAPGSLGIAERRLTAPAALLGALSPTLRAAELTGLIMLRASGVRIDDQATTGSGDLLWRDAGSSLTPVYPLGNYMMTLRGAGRGLDFNLASMGGALALSGSGQWRPGSPLALKATATPAPDQAKQLTPLLRIIGKHNGDGSYQLMLSGTAGLASL